MLKRILLFTITSTVITLNAQQNIESFMFGHSLMDHASDTEQTEIAYWINQFAQEAGHTYETGGQYGSMFVHADFNVVSQWGVMGVPSSWDQDNEDFEEASITNSVFTCRNFVQDIPCHEDYYGESKSVLQATQELIDSLDNYQAPIDLFLYENWPDMAPYTGEDPFNPTESEFQQYNDYTLGGFHNWWLEYHDSLIISHPSLNVRMIPVGPVIAELIQTYPFDTIPIMELYEDNAPHGTPNIYFLAGLATYMAIYGEKSPTSYTVPSSIHETISNNYQAAVDSIWNYFIAFEDDEGNNRVFLESTSPEDDMDGDGVSDEEDNCVDTANPSQEDYDMDGIGDACDSPENAVIIENGVLFNSDAEGILVKGRDDNCYLLYIDSNGELQTETRPCPE